MKWSAAEAELEATCQALDEGRENSKRIKSKASEKQESLLSQKINFKELNDEWKARICAEKCAREATAKAWDEIAKAVRQSSLSTRNWVLQRLNLNQPAEPWQKRGKATSKFNPSPLRNRSSSCPANQVLKAT